MVPLGKQPHGDSAWAGRVGSNGKIIVLEAINLVRSSHTSGNNNRPMTAVQQTQQIKRGDRNLGRKI